MMTPVVRVWSLGLVALSRGRSRIQMGGGMDLRIMDRQGIVGA